MQVSTEQTVFMQKAIYFVSKLIAARGIIELTDRSVNFQVSNLDASFGIKDLSVDLCAITGVSIAGGDIRPKIIIMTSDARYEFVMAKWQEFYDILVSMSHDPIEPDMALHHDDSGSLCDCGKHISRHFSYCPWCGKHR